ncbi:MAG: anion permease [Chloroflexota bacterium]|nr:anion permease [Chloroflexota bacterium]
MLDGFLLGLIITIALGFGFANGLNDAANAVAASIGSRALSPRVAIIIAAIANLTGCIHGAVIGAAVAKTIGKGIISPEAISGDLGYSIVIGAITAAIMWTLTATYLALPISVSHSLVAGLVGAGLATGSPIGWGKFEITLSAVVCAPLLGFLGGFILMVALFWFFYRAAPGRVRKAFARMQYFTTAFLAYAHGKNDGQMPIALMIMGLVLYYNDPNQWNDIHWGVIVAAAASISLGTAIGGWRVIKTVGFRVTKLDPPHGFTSDLSAGAVIEFASHLGIPVSTTHCSVASVMGVGSVQRLSAIRWGTTQSIVTAWILTFPICIALGWVFTNLLRLIL